MDHMDPWRSGKQSSSSQDQLVAWTVNEVKMNLIESGIVAWAVAVHEGERSWHPVGSFAFQRTIYTTGKSNFLRSLTAQLLGEEERPTYY